MAAPATRIARIGLAATVVACALAAVLALPASSLAHATLASSSPPADSPLGSPPTQVSLEFTADVVAGHDAVRVFAPDGSRVDDGHVTPERGRRLSIGLDEAGADGTYGVAYRVSSEDGHVITGATSFVVGDAGDGDGAATDAAGSAAATDHELQAAFSVVRFVEVVALLVAAGGGIFACLLAPGWRPRYVVAALFTVLAAYAVGFLINAALLRGAGIGDVLSADAIHETSQTPFGLSLQVRTIVATIAIAPALLLRRMTTHAPAARWAMALVFAGLAASLSITGHAVTTDPVQLRLPLDMVHVVAAAIWLGGLVQLLVMSPRAAEHLRDVERFSATAFACVLVILATGAYAALVEVGTSLDDVVGTTYGRLVAAKLLLYAGIMPLAFNNKSAFVPALVSRPDDAPAMLRQYVWRELAIVLAVVALTVWLIATPQP